MNLFHKNKDLFFLISNFIACYQSDLTWFIKNLFLLQVACLTPSTCTCWTVWPVTWCSTAATREQKVQSPSFTQKTGLWWVQFHPQALFCLSFRHCNHLVLYFPQALQSSLFSMALFYGILMLIVYNIALILWQRNILFA